MSLVRADALRIPLRDESVDLIVTSPPYFALRTYLDGGERCEGQIGSEPTPQDFLEALWAVTAECKRVLKPNGSLWVNLGDKYASSHQGIQGATGQRADRSEAKSKTRRPTDCGGVPVKSLMGLPWRYAIGCVDHLGLILRAEVIWSKPNGLPESVTDRVRRSHEQWFHLTKEPRYFAAMDEVRLPQRTLGERHEGRSGYVNATPDIARGFSERALNPLGKLPGSVWTIPSEPLKVPEHVGVDHFAAFPTEWPRRIILGWSPSGAVVLDPFCGTGTTVLVAEALGRHGIGIDLSADYLRLARWRIEESGHASKVIRRTWNEHNEEVALFGAEAAV